MKNKVKKIKEILKKQKKINIILSKIFNFLAFNTKYKKGHKITLKTKGSYFYKCKFIVNGSNNVIEFEDLCLFKKAIIKISGNNNHIKIGKEVMSNNLNICIENDNNKLIIGDKTYFAGNVHIAITEGKIVNIGNDCLFSNNIVIRTGDSHSILNKNTHERINQAKNINIGNHVWITERVIILKGSNINNDSIIASNSVITKKYNQNNIIIGGSPSKILKENVTWCHERI